MVLASPSSPARQQCRQGCRLPGPGLAPSRSPACPACPPSQAGCCGGTGGGRGLSFMRGPLQRLPSAAAEPPSLAPSEGTPGMTDAWQLRLFVLSPVWEIPLPHGSREPGETPSFLPRPGKTFLASDSCKPFVSRQVEATIALTCRRTVEETRRAAISPSTGKGNRSGTALQAARSLWPCPAPGWC